MARSLILAWFVWTSFHPVLWVYPYKMEEFSQLMAAYAEVYNLYNLGRHCISATNYKILSIRTIASWRNVVTS